MEVLENAAKINILANQLGTLIELDADQLAALDVWVGRKA